VGREIELRTERLTLRSFRTTDVDDALAYRDDPEFARFLPHVSLPFTRADAEAFVTLNMTEPWETIDALKPEEVWESMREWDVPMDQRDLRCTAGFLRQGEWFFLPRPWMEVYEPYILRREPIRRGAGKPHICERLHRKEGVEVYVCDAYPNGADLFSNHVHADLSNADAPIRDWFSGGHWYLDYKKLELTANGSGGYSDQEIDIQPAACNITQAQLCEPGH
jgi:hypothetical protein